MATFTCMFAHLKTYKKLHKSLFILLLTFGMGCQEIIDVNLDNAEPRYIVEAIVRDGIEPHIVHITQSIPVDSPNSFPFIGNATVILKDNFSQADTLHYIDSGYYFTQSFFAVQNNNYLLQIHIGNDTIRATSFMPISVPFDSVSFHSIQWMGKPRYLFIPHFNDPVSAENYYRFVLFQNKKPKSSIYILSDKDFNGQLSTQSFLASSKLESGDTIDIEMQCINKQVYDFYFTLNQLHGSIFVQSASPANPISNVTGNRVIGCFNACSSQILTYILP